MRADLVDRVRDFRNSRNSARGLSNDERLLLDEVEAALRALRDAPVVTIDGDFVVRYERGTEHAALAPLVGKRLRIVEAAE